MNNNDDRSVFKRYWWLVVGALSAVALSTAINISNTDGWIVLTNSSSDNWNINWNTTRPATCFSGNYSYWNGSGFLCSPDVSGGGNSSSDGNNYTTGIAFTGTTTKLLTLNRFGMTDLTASFTDLFQNYTTEINSLNSTIISLNSTKLNITDQRYNDTNAINNVSVLTQTKAFASSVTCGVGTYLQVLTINNGSWSTSCVAALTAEVDGSTTNELQNIFQTIATTSGTSPVADTTTDTLTLTAGSGITITGDSGTDTITFTATGGGGGSSFKPEQTNYYYKSYDFESVTSGFMDPWAPLAISTGTTALIAGEYLRPGLATVSTSATASSGYSYQITGVTTFLLGNGSGSIVIIAPIPKTGNLTTCRLGFQDVFTIANPVDGAYWNATQNNATHFNWTPVMRTNSVDVLGSTVQQTANTAQYFKAEVYVINTTQVRYTLYNSSVAGTILSQQLLNGTVPSVTGRETSHAAVCHTLGATTAQVMARLDYISVFNNATVFNR